MRRIKIGIIGAGGMLHSHVAGYRSADADVVALAGRNEAAVRQAAQTEGIPHSYTDVSRMIQAHPELDAISVIVPNRFHAPFALQALQAGKHVFCEKPPTLNAPEMETLLQAARAAGRTLMFNFNNRARPGSIAIMDFIRQGGVGRMNSAHAKWARRTGIPGFGGWFTSKALAGGGALIDLVHMLDLALYFMGYPEADWVLAQTFDDFANDRAFKGPWGIADAAGGAADVETACHGFVRFKTGQVISLQISWAEMVRGEEVSVAFQGTRAGGLLQRTFGVDGVDETALDVCELYTQENGRSVNRAIAVPPDETMGRTHCAANFIRVLRGEEPALSTPEEALSLMKIVDAIYASAHRGEPVRC